MTIFGSTAKAASSAITLELLNKAGNMIKIAKSVRRMGTPSLSLVLISLL
jgi:hypothetical protein